MQCYCTISPSPRIVRIHLPTKESTNIFNHTNVTGINNTATVDTAGNITTPASLAWTSALDQRLIQFGLKFKF